VRVSTSCNYTRREQRHAARLLRVSQGHNSTTGLDSVDVEHHHLVSRFEACHACTLVERDDLCPGHTCVCAESTVYSAPSHSPSLPCNLVCDPQTYLALDRRHASDGNYLDGGAERPVIAGRHVELWRASCPRRHCVRHARVTLFRCESSRTTLYARGIGLASAEAGTLGDRHAGRRRVRPLAWTIPTHASIQLRWTSGGVCACLRAGTHFLPAAGCSGCPVTSHTWLCPSTISQRGGGPRVRGRAREIPPPRGRALGEGAYMAAVGVYRRRGFIRSNKRPRRQCPLPPKRHTRVSPACCHRSRRCCPSSRWTRCGGGTHCLR